MIAEVGQLRNSGLRAGEGSFIALEGRGGVEGLYKLYEGDDGRTLTRGTAQCPTSFFLILIPHAWGLSLLLPFPPLPLR